MTALTSSFTVLQRALHWLMAICILAMLFIGVAMVRTIAPDYVTLITVHKTLGIAILVLALLRLAVRLRSGAPALPADLPVPMKLAAHLSHLAFYILMIVMPLIGWAMVSAAGYPIVLAGGIHLPPIVSPSRELHAILWTLHSYLAFAFFALVLVHIAAALYHALIRRDAVFRQMTAGDPAK
jgi:cytochrome b561